MWIVAVVYRFKYYFAWAVSESALIFSGFCFNGWDEKGEARWDRYCNTRVSHVELSASAAELPAHWNTCTGNFLRRCESQHLHDCFGCSYVNATPKGKSVPCLTICCKTVVEAHVSFGAAFVVGQR